MSRSLGLPGWPGGEGEVEAGRGDVYGGEGVVVGVGRPALLVAGPVAGAAAEVVSVAVLAAEGGRDGDGTFGYGAVLTHTYPAALTYTAVVTASNEVSTMTATTVVTITEPTHFIYLPLVLKHW